VDVILRNVPRVLSSLKMPAASSRKSYVLRICQNVKKTFSKGKFNKLFLHLTQKPDAKTGGVEVNWRKIRELCPTENHLCYIIQHSYGLSAVELKVINLNFYFLDITDSWPKVPVAVRTMMRMR
jgi:hypothetical protein